MGNAPGCSLVQAAAAPAERGGGGLSNRGLRRHGPDPCRAGGPAAAFPNMVVSTRAG
jgi:hypothetical protein